MHLLLGTSTTVPKLSRVEARKLQRAKEGVATKQTAQSDVRESQKQAGKNQIFRSIAFDQLKDLIKLDIESYNIAKEFFDNDQKKAAVAAIQVLTDKLKALKEENDLDTANEKVRVAEMQSLAAGIKKEQTPSTGGASNRKNKTVAKYVFSTPSTGGTSSSSDSMPNKKKIKT
jgi:hypothetical protein